MRPSCSLLQWVTQYNPALHPLHPLLMMSHLISPGCFFKFVWSLAGEWNSHVALDFESGWSHSDNQRTIWLCCLADAKPTVITFTFTLHYCLFIHRVLSGWGLSGMIDGANVFALKMERGAESIQTEALSLYAEKVTRYRNDSFSREIKVEWCQRINVICWVFDRTTDRCYHTFTCIGRTSCGWLYLLHTSRAAAISQLIT